MEKIYRSIQRLDSNAEGRTISGYAVVFESWSRDLGGFKEMIHRSAITEELLAESDIILNVNHDDNQMLARYRGGEGTLKVELRDEGLYIEFEAPDTALGNEVLYHVRNGNYNEMSFCFALPTDDSACERWYLDDEDNLFREINKIAWLHDCSIVTTAAYADTSVQARSIEQAQEAMKTLKAEKDAQIKAQINEKLDAKLNDFMQSLNL